MTKGEAYLKKLILWIRIMITVVVPFTLFKIVVWNFFAPTSKEVSHRVRDKLLNWINSVNLAGLVAKGDS